MFAIRSPRRPNPIGVTVVSLLGIDGNRVSVRGVDMLDGTPLLETYNQVEPVRTIADDRFHKGDK